MNKEILIQSLYNSMCNLAFTLAEAIERAETPRRQVKGRLVHRGMRKTTQVYAVAKGARERGDTENNK